MAALEVDFDVFKALTARRENEAVTYNDVLRDLLDLGAKPTFKPENTTCWTWKSVELPHGTELRAEYKGKAYTAKIVNGEWIQEGEKYSSPSAAAHAITQSGINGWWFWSVKRPQDIDFDALGKLRSAALIGG